MAILNGATAVVGITAVFGGVLISLTATFACCMVLDVLLKHVIAEHPGEWNRCGRPRGYFYCPPGSDMSFRGTLKLRSVFWRWVWLTPPELTADHIGRGLVHWVRFLVIAIVVGWMMGALGILMASLSG